MMAWNSDPLFIEEIWAEAQDIEPSMLQAVLDAAHAACATWAPVLPLGASVPDAWLIAEIYQARHIWATFQGSNQGEIGPDGFVITASTWPLVLAARDLLRPKTQPLSRLR